MRLPPTHGDWITSGKNPLGQLLAEQPLQLGGKRASPSPGVELQLPCRIGAPAGARPSGPLASPSLTPSSSAWLAALQGGGVDGGGGGGMGATVAIPGAPTAPHSLTR